MPILSVMGAVDSVLRMAVQTRRLTLARPTVIEDPFRGLHLSGEDITAELDGAAAMPLVNRQGGLVDWMQAAAAHPPLAAMIAAYGLAPVEVGALLLVLAPEIDGRYDRVFAFLHDDVTRRAPTVGLLSRLLYDDAADVVLGRRLFSPDGRLIAHRLIRLETAGNFLGSIARVDPQIVRFSLEEAAVDLRLEGITTLIEGKSGPAWPETAIARAVGLVRGAAAARLPGPVYLRAAGTISAREASRVAAAAIERHLLESDLARWPGEADPVETVRLLVRETWLFDRLLLLQGVDAFRARDPLAFREIARILARFPGPVLLAGNEPWHDDPAAELGPVVIDLAVTDAGERHAAWRQELAARSVEVAEQDLATLAGRFRLQPGQIATAASELAVLARLEGARVGLVELAAAVRRRTGQALERLAQRIAPRHGWSDLVLPGPVELQLREIVARVAMKDAVLDGWGLRRSGPGGNGTVALFAGPSGTGKTLAAEIVAGALQLDLFRIDLARVVDKYIGETEKNLDRIFSAAEHLDAVLLFDEADALFGKRSEVKDAHDRYANLEIAYLLQKMEAYEGVAILSTNLLHNMDEAFIRRLAFVVHFPFPDEIEREQIWRVCCPASLPLGADIDFADLALRYRLSGGNIRNAVTAAAYLAAAEGDIVRLAHMERAIAREYQKMGRLQGALGRPAAPSGGVP